MTDPTPGRQSADERRSWKQARKEVVSRSNNRRYKEVRNELFAEQSGKCYWCHRPMTNHTDRYADDWLVPNLCTLDHIEPRALFSDRRLFQMRRNMVAACYACNVTKSNKPVRDWLEIVTKMRSRND